MECFKRFRMCNIKISQLGKDVKPHISNKFTFYQITKAIFFEHENRTHQYNARANLFVHPKDEL